ncbi:MBL fold metallo-hydrolase [Bosea sp. 2YAB26]|uniref:MBL fold metallo-hydrolase n=1 Tax=Bosea sp. 2YAB26 TaxID=3237478 RepID=UPI003F907CC6
MASISLAFGVVLSAAALAQSAQEGGKVKVEWLGHEFYRLTSPKGIVVLTSPWLGNPDGPIALADLTPTDFILVPNAHNDDMGNPIEIAAQSDATVITPGPLGRWLVSNGLKQEQFRRAGIGDRFTLKGITFKIAPSGHDNTLPSGADGGPSVAFFITFENGFTVFYNGHSTLLGDLPLYAALYKPDLAILGLAGDPPEFAQVARLLTNGNPKLKRVIPSHMRPDAVILKEGKKELDQLGLGNLMYVPKLRAIEEYP